MVEFVEPTLTEIVDQLKALRRDADRLPNGKGKQNLLARFDRLDVSSAEVLMADKWAAPSLAALAQYCNKTLGCSLPFERAG